MFSVLLNIQFLSVYTQFNNYVFCSFETKTHEYPLSMLRIIIGIVVVLSAANKK